MSTTTVNNYPRLTHIALHVEDLEACKDFYSRYCNLQLVHSRSAGNQQIIWLAEPRREHDFVFVLMSGGRDTTPAGDDYRHFGFAMDSRQAVDDIAIKARNDNILAWEPRQDPYPAGYYCGVRDPNGNYVEFSYGQPLGPGALPLPDSGMSL